jgi:hypothetical protein
MSENFAHGASGYNNHGCKCDVCRAGHAEKMRKYRKRRKQNGGRWLHGRFIPDPVPAALR